MTGSRWTKDNVVRAATSGIDKIRKDGLRGITLCSMVEIEALAIVAATSPLLNSPAPKPNEESDDA